MTNINSVNSSSVKNTCNGVSSFAIAPCLIRQLTCNRSSQNDAYKKRFSYCTVYKNVTLQCSLTGFHSYLVCVNHTCKYVTYILKCPIHSCCMKYAYHRQQVRLSPFSKGHNLLEQEKILQDEHWNSITTQLQAPLTLCNQSVHMPAAFSSSILCQ